jgi:Holliday junction resolvasome RuvABC DNA-binding subunit
LVEALVGLGYRRGEAEQAAGAARTESDDEATQLRLALKRLQGGVGGT